MTEKKKKLELNTFNKLFREKYGIKGSGTSEDPYIIESASEIEDIKNSKKHIIIKNCDFTPVVTLRCYSIQNITFVNCKFSDIEITEASNINFSNCNIEGHLFILSQSINNKIENSEISWFVLNLTRKNIILESEIKRLTVDDSRGNIFENCTIPEIFLKESKFNPPLRNFKNEFKRKHRIFLIIPVITILIISFVLYMIFNERISIEPFVVMWCMVIGFTSLIVILFDWLPYKKISHILKELENELLNKID